MKKRKVLSAEIVVRGTKKEPYYLIRYVSALDGETHNGCYSFYLDFVFDWMEENLEIVKGGDLNVKEND